MPEYIVSSLYHLFFRVTGYGQALFVPVQKVANGKFRGVPGRLLISPVVNTQFLYFQGLLFSSAAPRAILRQPFGSHGSKPTLQTGDQGFRA